MGEEDNPAEEITRIGKCIVSVNRVGDIHIKCEEPITRLDIEKSDLDLIAGISDVIEVNADVIKKDSKGN